VLYTDGLIERRAEPIDTGIERLASTLTSLGDAGPDEICDRTVPALLDGETSSDDIALLCVLLRPHDEATLHLSLPPEPSRLAKVREEMTSWMHRLGGAPDRTELLVAAANEAVANAVEHGSETGLDIVVEGSLEDERAVIVVRDAGRWTGSPRARGAADQDEGAGGRGLALMHALVDEVEVRPGPGGTAVVLRHRVLDA
jgi:anti-sigma regulatory factor (Ser/Thr protein kinase)